MTRTPHAFANHSFLFRWVSCLALVSACVAFALDCALAPPSSGGSRLLAATAPPESRSGEDSSLSRAVHLERLGVAAWHKAGHRGCGVKVLVLDTGFTGYRDHLGHALPERVTVKSFRTDGNLEAKASQHGILCGEVVHALAPDAAILFANWETDRPDQFLDAVRWAKQQGVQVITCSVITPSWSDCEGGGTVHCELAKILGDGERGGDLLFFASAGNTAERHWSGPFAPCAENGADGFHEWQTGCRDNSIQPWAAKSSRWNCVARRGLVSICRSMT
jgi:hypothetical protein